MLLLSTRYAQSESELTATFWSRSIGLEVGGPDQRETDPHAGAEIQRHPGDLLVPVVPPVRHDAPLPAIAQSVAEGQRGATGRAIGPVPRDVHGNLGGAHEDQVGAQQEEGDLEEAPPSAI